MNALQPKVAVSCCMLCKVQCECFTAESNCAVMHGTAEGKYLLLCSYAQLKVNVSCAAMHSTAEGKCLLLCSYAQYS